jgi:uncharacterized protein
MTAQTPAIEPADGPFDGHRLAAAYRAGARWLSRHAARVDALNVFPVPDGDTGTNMRLTLEAAVAAVVRQPSADAGAVAQTAAEAALLGARGNSGVILSQILAGAAVALRGRATVSDAALACVAEEAVRFAYKAVTEPVEGTILTAVREAAEAVRGALLRGASRREALEDAVRAARAAVERSPDLLPKLRQAGVVDAGAEGLTVILDGVLRAARGEPLEIDGVLEVVRPTAAAVSEGAHALDESGYCTNFLVRGVTADLETVRPAIQALGASVVVAGAGTLLKVHLHTEHPGLALEAGARFGELAAIEIANMRDQVAAIRAADSAAGAIQPPPTPQRSPDEAAVLAVAPSPEFAAIFRGFNVETIPGGQSMNPSVGQLVAAIEGTGARHVFVLPNNANILLTAREAGRRSSRAVTVIPTTSLPQGVAAAVAFLADRTDTDNARTMAEAIGTVATIEVATAARATTVDDQAVAAGRAIAVADDRLVATGDDPAAAALAAVVKSWRPEHTLVTIYTGEAATPDRTGWLQEQLAERLPGAALEVVPGGQPHYPYILALE